ncbi:MAG TPA: VOC family protein [Acidimicrobiales bacterium]|nr:VOC family protein [Acidimicrobiales bacterium]
MRPGFDHVTIVVTDLDEARRFFELLGFEESQTVVVSGEQMAKYMGIADWEADHVTLVHTGSETHQEVQLLRFHTPPVQVDAETGNLARTGFNHVCFRVDDVDAMIEKLQAAGIGIRNQVMTFHDRRLVFLQGPGGVTIELAQWLAQPAVQ